MSDSELSERSGVVMALDRAVAVGAFFLLTAVALAPVQAADHTVGGSTGWDASGDYSSWASAQTFAPGDTLTFNYGGLHSVSQVSKSDYESCSTSNAVQTDSSGTTKIKLDKPSTTYYFICGTPGHCSEGMKLAVTTTSSASSSSSSSSGGTTTRTASGANSRMKVVHQSILCVLLMGLYGLFVLG